MEQLQDPILLRAQRNEVKSSNSSNIRIWSGICGLCKRTNNWGLNEPSIQNRGRQEYGCIIERHKHENHGLIDKNQSDFNSCIDRSRSIENTNNIWWRWSERASHSTTKKSENPKAFFYVSTTTQTTVVHMGMIYPTIIPAPVSNGRIPDKNIRPPSLTTWEKIKLENK